MSVPLTVNGTTFQYPQEFDTHWGPTLTAWSTAVTNALAPLTGGILTLPYPTSGILYQNSTLTGYLSLTINASNQLTFNGVPIGAATTLTDGHIFVGNVLNQPADVLMSGDITITNTGVTALGALKVVNAQISATAAIALSKLASTAPYFWYAADSGGVLTPLGVTASKAVITDANGLPSASTVTSTEIGYLSGLVSNLQAQLNALAAMNFVPTGTFADFGGPTPPTGWLVRDGSVISQTTYAALYAAIGTTWNTGGEGAGNFRLPNSTRRVSVGSGGSGTATLGNSVGNVGGEETHTLSTAELATHGHSASQAAHNHAFTGAPGATTQALGWYGTDGNNAASPNGVGTSGVGGINVSNTNGNVAKITVVNATPTVTVTDTGSGTAHNNIQPSEVVLKIIKY
jgi:microcystin-dependent protein